MAILHTGTVPDSDPHHPAVVLQATVQSLNGDDRALTAVSQLLEAFDRVRTRLLIGGDSFAVVG